MSRMIATLGDDVMIANNVVMGGHVAIADHAVIGGRRRSINLCASAAGGDDRRRFRGRGRRDPVRQRHRQPGAAGWAERDRLEAARGRPAAAHAAPAAVRQLFWGARRVHRPVGAVRAAYGADPLMAEVLEIRLRADQAGPDPRHRPNRRHLSRVGGANLVHHSGAHGTRRAAPRAPHAPRRHAGSILEGRAGPA